MLGAGMHTSPSNVPGQGARCKDTATQATSHVAEMDSYEYTVMAAVMVAASL